jgi:hypothetical protein
MLSSCLTSPVLGGFLRSDTLADDAVLAQTQQVSEELV